jgi:hypothetical protein
LASSSFACTLAVCFGRCRFRLFCQLFTVLISPRSRSERPILMCGFGCLNGFAQLFDFELLS